MRLLGGSSPVSARADMQKASERVVDMNGASCDSASQNSAINRYGALTLGNVEDCFTYHGPSGMTLEAMNMVRESSIAMAKAILRVVPDCADRSTALRKLREARMWANSALALGGRF